MRKAEARAWSRYQGKWIRGTDHMPIGMTFRSCPIDRSRSNQLQDTQAECRPGHCRKQKQTAYSSHTNEVGGGILFQPRSVAVTDQNIQTLSTEREKKIKNYDFCRAG